MKQNKTISTAVIVVRVIRSLTIISLIVMLIAAVASSCAPSIKVSADYDRSVNFSAYKTFAMYDVKASSNVNKLNQDRIEKYIRMEMTKRGYVESKVNPDLRVNAVTVLKNRRGISASTSYYGGGFYRPYGVWGAPVSGYTSVSTYDYKDGSLVIDVIDSKINKMVWTGSAVAEIYNSPKNPEEAISTTVTKIMAGYPIGTVTTQIAKIN
jgi:hypothetical protein